MRQFKPSAFPAVSLAAFIVLLATSGGVTLAQSPAAKSTIIANTTVAAQAPTAISAADEDIRDIRPPIHIPYSWLWAAYVAGGLGLAGLALATWRWLRWYRQSRRKQLYELTLDELESVRALMEPGKAYPFSIAVSEIIRNYIEKRFQVRAAHRTTEEFFHDLLAESHAGLAAHQPLLAEFLEHCDLAKFARWQLSVAQMEAMHHSAGTFVLETGKPAASAATEPTANHEPTLLESRST